MTNLEARQKLKDGGSQAELLDAVWQVYLDTEANIFDLAEGFKYDEIIYYQTKNAVMRRLNRMTEEERDKVVQELLRRNRSRKTNAPSCADEAR